MNILSLSVSHMVKNVKTSSEFLIKHFDFMEIIAADGFASLIHETTNLEAEEERLRSEGVVIEMVEWINKGESLRKKGKIVSSSV